MNVVRDKVKTKTETLGTQNEEIGEKGRISKGAMASRVASETKRRDGFQERKLVNCVKCCH